MPGHFSNHLKNLRHRLTILSANEEIIFFVKKGGVSLSLKLLSGIIGFAINIVISRMLGAQGAGLFFLALTLTTVIGVVLQFGCDQVLTRFISINSSNKDWHKVNGIYRTVLLLNISLGLALIALLIINSRIISRNLLGDESLYTIINIMAFAGLPFAVFWMHAHCFQGIGNTNKFQWFQNLGVSVVFLIIIFTLRLITEDSLSPLDLSYIYLCSCVFTAATAFYLWTRQPFFSFVEGHFPAQKIIRSAFPLFLIAVLGLLMNWFCQVALGFFHSTEDVGVFTVALRSAALVSIVLMTVNSVVLPRFASLYANGEIEKLRALVILSTRAMLILCAPALLFMIIFPDWIMGLFGAEFSKNGDILIILVVGQLINVATGSVGGLLNMTGNEREALIANILSIIFMVILGFILIPAKGLLGAAITQTLALSFQMIAMTVYAKRKLGFMPASIFSRV